MIGTDRLIQTLLTSFGLTSKMAEHRLLAAWPEIVGSQVAAHTHPTEIRAKTLRVVVDSSPWLHELTLLKPALLDKLARHADRTLVCDVLFTIGDLPPRERPTADAPPPRPLTAEEEALVNASVSALTDVDTRESARRLLIRALQDSGRIPE